MILKINKDKIHPIKNNLIYLLKYTILNNLLQ